jgi:hypothetical protein
MEAAIASTGLTRRQGVILCVIPTLFLWMSIAACFIASGGDPSTLGVLISEATGLFVGIWVWSTVKAWFKLAPLVMQLADEAASELDSGESPEVQIAQTMVRLLPPRQMYACAIAHRGRPIKMLRGWKMLTSRPLTKPEDTRSAGFSCRVYRG